MTERLPDPAQTGAVVAALRTAAADAGPAQRTALQVLIRYADQCDRLALRIAGTPEGPPRDQLLDQFRLYHGLFLTFRDRLRPAEHPQPPAPEIDRHPQAGRPDSSGGLGHHSSHDGSSEAGETP